MYQKPRPSTRTPYFRWLTRKERCIQRRRNSRTTQHYGQGMKDHLTRKQFAELAGMYPDTISKNIHSDTLSTAEKDKS